MSDPSPINSTTLEHSHDDDHSNKYNMEPSTTILGLILTISLCLGLLFAFYLTMMYLVLRERRRERALGYQLSHYNSNDNNELDADPEAKRQRMQDIQSHVKIWKWSSPSSSSGDDEEEGTNTAPCSDSDSDHGFHNNKLHEAEGVDTSNSANSSNIEADSNACPMEQDDEKNDIIGNQNHPLHCLDLESDQSMINEEEEPTITMADSLMEEGRIMTIGSNISNISGVGGRSFTQDDHDIIHNNNHGGALRCLSDALLISHSCSFLCEQDQSPRKRRSQHNNEEELQRPHCSICLSAFVNQDVVCQSHNPKCNHTFHLTCMTQWLMVHDECPLCRQCYVVARQEDPHHDAPPPSEVVDVDDDDQQDDTPQPTTVTECSTI
mmetsp:Transcript_4448/g.9330  ORF Transcript_4448/g.9330 Transcript_4448/m.9330 type:complete len:380 (-) Transcript_4448:40-1179(-)|eukprot:CAMPEP_0168761082 /NCGR_PEP_ID=MMETSP0724-20121128/23110_1 /TAXON_ID=265536 /ORGANISM="Amphiprora sp., Strain CCMP467" /LENGTH=379 /DNA_ID=CAMNT_0008810135 /DNA_START=275 /DNA_END=1411 /DNA_ORIENTATION=+